MWSSHSDLRHMIGRLMCVNEESFVRIEASSQNVVWQDRQFSDELGLYQE